MSVLERGGNAFDAAVAAGFTLQVVEPHLNGPGGDVPAVFYSKAQDEVRVLCGQGPAPASATIDAYRTRGLELVPGVGPLAAVVPGAFDAWLLMLRELGTWELARRDGAGDRLRARRLSGGAGDRGGDRGVEDLLRTEWTSSAEIYLPAPQPGQLFRNLPLADAYGRLAQSQGGSREARIDAAREAFYERLGGGGGRLVLRGRGRAADRRRPRALGGDLRGAGHARLPRAHDLQDRAVGAGPGDAPAARAARGLRPRRDGPGRVRAHRARVREAGLRGPRGLVRRPGLRRRAARGAAERRVCRAAARAGGRAGVATSCAPARRTAASRSCRRRRPWSTAAARRRRSRRSAWPATPATSTSPTATATSSPPPRAAAGSTAPRSSPASASAWARARRCSGSPRGCRTRSSRASARARR